MIDPINSQIQNVALDQVISEPGSSASNSIEEVLASVSPSSNDTFSNEFIQKLSSLNESIVDTKDNLVQNIQAKGDDLSPADLLSYQMDIYKITLQVDLSSKCVSKNNQNCDTLLKAQ